MGDGVGHRETFRFVTPTGDLQFNKLGRPFTVPDDGLRQLQTQAVQGLLKLLKEVRIRFIDHDPGSTCAGDHRRVVGRGISVHGDAIEAGGHRTPENRLQ